MRKIDYVKLADTLAIDIAFSNSAIDWHLTKGLACDSVPELTQHRAMVTYYEKRRDHTKDIARKLSSVLSVNAAEFLKACGID